MSTGFLATNPTPAATEEGDITSAPFWPAISLCVLRDTVRLDGTVTTARLKHAVIDAITSVNRDGAAPEKVKVTPPWPPYPPSPSAANRYICTATGAPSTP